MNEAFQRFSNRGTAVLGSPAAFLIACIVLLIWAASGPAFDFSEAWQMTIHTGTAIVTFLMVFVIQASQNRDTMALQLKLDELLRAVNHARTHLVGLEDWSEEDLARLQNEFREVRRQRSPGESPARPEKQPEDRQTAPSAAGEQTG